MKHWGHALMLLALVYVVGYMALRITGEATIFSYGTGERELWSNIDRMPTVGKTLQAMYLPLIYAECSTRDLEWSP